ncbi:MAG: heterodisulfide reductase-related iron-sulfur binding cluster [Desulfovermiculus sp.]|nr:heterodisulfide reductase-related iron-sulfur binding cluster [Desulfovermiculus sp.]
MKNKINQLAFFPGCSMATSAQENFASLRSFCLNIGYELHEIPDWNCCGTSSAHAVNSELAFELACRNLALMHSYEQVLIACPSCFKRLKQAFLHLQTDPQAQARFERKWQTDLNPRLDLIPFLRFLSEQDLRSRFAQAENKLRDLRVVPYYGCMLAYPPIMNHEPSMHGIMEKVMRDLGAKPLSWPHARKCCGTFLSVARPDMVTPLVNKIFAGAAQVGADCIVTACSMCHLNLEVRCTHKPALPVFHFSELLALAMGAGSQKDWFTRHLNDPRPLLRSKGLIA